MTGGSTTSTRRTLALQHRRDAADVAHLRPHPPHHTNGEETSYTNPAGELSYIANFPRGFRTRRSARSSLPRTVALLRSLATRDPDDFEEVPPCCATSTSSTTARTPGRTRPWTPPHRSPTTSRCSRVPATTRARSHRGNDTYLLPQAFPEGSPVHPSYGAGHATVAGACVTILKAFFDESFVIGTPVVPDAAGTALVPYNPPPGEPPLTVGGELNKLAANISIGRNVAGAHWRTDYTASVRMGEAIALACSRNSTRATTSITAVFALTTFDGLGVAI